MATRVSHSSRTPARIQYPDKWNLKSLPPKGNVDVAPFVQKLIDEALHYRRVKNFKQKWIDNHRLFTGNHWEHTLKVFTGRSNKLSINILGANIHRTVANITARAPVAEVKASGQGPEAQQFNAVMTEKMRLWNNQDEQQESLTHSTYNQEIYGVATEKAVYDKETQTGYSIPLDPFAFAPAPGNWLHWNQCPYVTHFYSMDVNVARDRFRAQDIKPDFHIHDILGEERGDESVHKYGRKDRSINASENYVPVQGPQDSGEEYQAGKCLIAETWIRDYSRDAEGNLTHPGGVRVVWTTNRGHVLLDDTKNPNINYGLEDELTKKTFLYNKFPFFKSVSYVDTASPMGLSMAEQTGDINLAIDDLWSQIMLYLKMAMFPPLILPMDTGVPIGKVVYKPRLILRPNSSTTGQGIRWLDMPAPPSWMFKALDVLLAFFDRVSQIEDADRGQAPGSVIAASAIEMLQERGAVLIRSKIRAVDKLVRYRGRCALSFYQNFGTEYELIEAGDQQVAVRGIDLVGADFEYIVESGSTVAKTEVQERQEMRELYKEGAVDRRALLEKLKVQGWQQILERTAETQLDRALQILIEAGLEKNMALQLKEFLMQSQTGGNPSGEEQGVPGQPGAPAKPGTPKADQGAATA